MHTNFAENMEDNKKAENARWNWTILCWFSCFYRLHRTTDSKTLFM